MQSEEQKLPKEQEITVTTFIKFDLLDRMKLLFGLTVKVDTKVIIPQDNKIEIFNCVSNTSLVSSTGLFTKQNRPPFGYVSF